jgi:hypothetical protein
MPADTFKTYASTLDIRRLVRPQLRASNLKTEVTRILVKSLVAIARSNE